MLSTVLTTITITITASVISTRPAANIKVDRLMVLGFIIIISVNSKQRVKVIKKFAAPIIEIKCVIKSPFIKF